MSVMPLLPAPPDASTVTAYDRAHAAVYLRLLDAEAAGAGWREAARHVLDQDVLGHPTAAHGMHASHLQRARWLRDGGILRVLGE